MDRRKAFQLTAALLALCAVILSLLPNGMGMVYCVLLLLHFLAAVFLRK